ncbi:ATP-binding protein, partial [Nanoarchaeota archaeon]
FQNIQSRIENLDRVLEMTQDMFVIVPNTLLYGPPGTGKTKIAKTFAAQADIPFVEVSLSSVGSTYHDGAMLNIEKKFNEAGDIIRKGAARIAVMYIDEITSMVRARFGSSSKEDDKVVETFTSNTGEGNQVPGLMVIGGTNSVQCISQAVLSRFNVLPFPAPDIETQSRIIGLYMDRYSSQSKTGIFSSVDPASVAEYCVHDNGARFVARDLRQVIGSMVGSVIDNVLSGNDYSIDEERFLEHVEQYKDRKSLEDKPDYS